MGKEVFCEFLRKFILVMQLSDIILVLLRMIDITCFAIAKNLKYIVSGSNDGSIKIIPFSAALQFASKEHPQHLPFDHKGKQHIKHSV